MPTSAKANATPLAVGTHVGGKYRSATWTGRIHSVIKPASKKGDIEYSIKPDADSKHPGEGEYIHRYGRSIHVIHS